MAGVNAPLIVMWEKACFKESLVSLMKSSDEEIHRIVSHVTCVTCELDPLPSKQSQQCLPSLVPVITAITNKSLAEGTVPTSLKVALVRQLLKKPSLDQDMLQVC